MIYLDYWVDTKVFYEQPKVKHLNELMVYVYTDEGVFSFGSTKALNDMVEGTQYL